MSSNSDDDIELESPNFRESMSPQEVSAWLKYNGIPGKFSDLFEENYIDGSEFVALTESEIKSMVPPIGLAKKVIKLLPKACPKVISDIPSSESPQLCSTPPNHSTSTGEDAGSSSSKLPNESVDIPSHWRPEVEECIKGLCLTDSARSEIIRVLVTQLFARTRKPLRMDCEIHARKLILKYPFMKDDMGNGYQSWSDKMITRVRNVIKRDKVRMPNSEAGLPDAKRKKSSIVKGKALLLRRYPVGVDVSVEDQDSLDVHRKALSDELAKSKPRDSVLLPLCKSTYHERRLFIQNEATSVKQIIEKYPALSRRSIMDQEMKMIVGKDVKSCFLAEWEKYVPAIIEYGRKSTKKALYYRVFQLEAESDDAEGVKELMALKIVTQALVKNDAMPYVYEEYEMESMDEAYQTPPLRNSPRIGVFKNETSSSKYYVFCEQFTLCEVPNLKSALFYMFSAYYIFNLEYPKPAQNIFFFLQDYILSYPDSLKRPSSYLAVLSDIKRNMQ